METTVTQQYLSDRFTSEDFANMSNDRIYAFYSVPDTGKTTMIINVLQPYLKESNKKALYLSHRTSINNQNDKNFNNTLIHSKLYQKIENDIIDKNNFYTDYDFIICDEAHYFVEDSTMNNLTDVSFNFVNNSNAIIILMTGTPDYLEAIKDHWNRPIVMLADIDKKHHNLTKVCLASATNYEEELLKSELDRLVEMNKRIIIYDSNIADLYALSREYKQRQTELGVKVSFICSNKNKKFAKHSDKDSLKVLMDTKHIDSKLLFITSALNTGVSIDEDFDYLFIFGNPTKNDIIQLIARVRKGDNDRRFKTVYCSVPKRSSLHLKMKALMSDLAYQDDPIEWQKKMKSKSFPDFMKLNHTFVYDNEGKQLFTPEGKIKTEACPDVNYMKLGKLQQDIKEYKTLLGFCSPMEAYQKMFNDRYENIMVYSLKDEWEQQGVQQVALMIDQYTHLEYLEEDQQKVIKTICKNYGLPISISKINDLFNKYNFRFYLISDQKKSKGHKFQAWYIKRY